jgi:hypothetical protein
MKLINKQTVVAVLIGMCVPIFCLLAINRYGRSSGAQARVVSETRIVPAADVPAARVPALVCPDMASTQPAAPGMAAPPSLAWQAPAGWTDAGTKGLRLANFAIGPAGEAECYVTVLGGTGGGVAMNVNRWRAQVGLPEATEEEISALPKTAMLGGEAVLLDVEGTYGGTTDGAHTGGDSRESYRLLGAIAQRAKDAVFVKMTGPAGMVAGERENFLAFAGSIRDAAASTAAAGDREY